MRFQPRLKNQRSGHPINCFGSLLDGQIGFAEQAVGLG
jgi:hypothetical protein